MCERSGRVGVNVDEEKIARVALWAVKEGIAVEEIAAGSKTGKRTRIKHILKDACNKIACDSASGFTCAVKGKVTTLQSDGGICPKQPQSRRSRLIPKDSSPNWCPSGWCTLSDGPSLDSTIVLHGIPARLFPALQRAMKSDQTVLVKVILNEDRRAGGA